MSKRNADVSASDLRTQNGSDAPEVEYSIGGQRLADMGDFEDDEFESEHEIESDAEIASDGADSEDELTVLGADGEEVKDDSAMDIDSKPEAQAARHGEDIYIPSKGRQLNKDEILEPDPSAYEMLHAFTASWPCLSFDVLQDDLGDERRSFPMEMYLVAGTQAESRRGGNEILVMKLSELAKTQENLDDSDAESDTSSNSPSSDPILTTKTLSTKHTTNRIRAFTPFRDTDNAPLSHLAASMSEDGSVHLWDLSPQMATFANPSNPIRKPKDTSPIHTIKSHGLVEGYAVDWSTKSASGKLATGDNDGRIFLTSLLPSGSWSTDSTPFTGHTDAVEEIQWSPVEGNVFASCSSDGTVRIWDSRQKTHKHAIKVEVSSSDVNVMSWCKKTPHFLATGADDGVWAVWDLRSFPRSATDAAPRALIDPTWHQKAITSIQFHPSEDSIVAVASADETITLWDLAVEEDRDEEEMMVGGRLASGVVPQNLMFVHYQKDVKEVRWHPQAPGVVIGTGGDGFNVFKTISV